AGWGEVDAGWGGPPAGAQCPCCPELAATLGVAVLRFGDGGRTADLVDLAPRLVERVDAVPQSVEPLVGVRDAWLHHVDGEGTHPGSHLLSFDDAVFDFDESLVALPLRQLGRR